MGIKFEFSWDQEGGTIVIKGLISMSSQQRQQPFTQKISQKHQLPPVTVSNTAAKDP